MRVLILIQDDENPEYPIIDAVSEEGTRLVRINLPHDGEPASIIVQDNGSHLTRTYGAVTEMRIGLLTDLDDSTWIDAPVAIVAAKRYERVGTGILKNMKCDRCKEQASELCIDHSNVEWPIVPVCENCEKSENFYVQH